MIGGLENLTRGQGVGGVQTKDAGSGFRDDAIAGSVGIERGLGGIEGSGAADVLPGDGLIEGLGSGSTAGIEVAIEEGASDEGEVCGERANINWLGI